MVRLGPSVKRRSKKIIIGGLDRISYESGTLVFTYLSWDATKTINLQTWWNALRMLDRPRRDGG